jgi:DNA gyrase subunit A
MVLGKVRPVNIEDEMRNSYLDYAMSVIISRALPDVRDGLKPVHRRILYAMHDMGMAHGTPYKKSARIVGEVLGKYHPHGDSSVYEAMVRMAQDFSMRYPLVDGQGNFGSVDNDPPAAMRYTEARLTKIAGEMLIDIDKDTVEFVPNFDDSLKEPSVLPARLPNLLVNGSAGIAVGMATNIPPHNLVEICDAIDYLLDNPEALVDDLMHFVKGPDFPTAGIILGQDGIKSAYATGHGRIVVRARYHVADATTGHRQIVITELPYETNKASLVERIAELVKDKKINGIADLRDESDRQGMRIVIELKREAQTQQVVNSLYKYTAMQSAFNANMVALVQGQPRLISLKEALQHYIEFRKEVIVRRTKYELKLAKDRAHILEGLKIALDHIDEVIRTIRQSETAEVARTALMEKFGLSQLQAQAILDMQLRRLASLERNKILEEYAELLKKISYLEDVLANPRRVLMIVKEETAALKTEFGDARRTEISAEGETEFSVEDLIPHERVVVTLSNRGFVKRVPSDKYRVQHRKGQGIKGMPTREEDAVRMLTVADTHDNMLFFTNRGKVFSLKCYELPSDVSRVAKGTAIINLFPLGENERVTAMVALTTFKPDIYLLMGTYMGEIKKTALENFAAVRSSGLIAMDLEEKDELVGVCLAEDKDDVILVTEKGQAIRFPVAELRASSRTSGGVRGIKLEEGDRLVGIDIVCPDAYIFAITTRGQGKLTAVQRYPLQHRAGGGVKTFKITSVTGPVAAAKLVYPTQQLMVVSAEGIVMRLLVNDITVLGRRTQGVIVMRVENNDKVVAVTCFENSAVEADSEKEEKAGKAAKTEKGEKAPRGKTAKTDKTDKAAPVVKATRAVKTVKPPTGLGRPSTEKA